MVGAGLFYLFWLMPVIGLAHVVLFGQDYVEAGLFESRVYCCSSRRAVR